MYCVIVDGIPLLVGANSRANERHASLLANGRVQPRVFTLAVARRDGTSRKHHRCWGHHRGGIIVVEGIALWAIRATAALVQMSAEPNLFELCRVQPRVSKGRPYTQWQGIIAASSSRQGIIMKCGRCREPRCALGRAHLRSEQARDLRVRSPRLINEE